MSMIRGSSMLCRLSVKKWQSLSAASFSRPMSSKMTMDDEDDEHEEELVPLAGTKTYENLREAFAKKAMVGMNSRDQSLYHCPPGPSLPLSYYFR
mmetsp:Transcript_15257/g.62311  ORF Transcript_15257/g.62311 Transcript_15257/m.62311 type:complete len:95 (+) Transcript_15257:644-928(+)